MHTRHFSAGVCYLFILSFDGYVETLPQHRNALPQQAHGVLSATYRPCTWEQTCCNSPKLQIAWVRPGKSHTRPLHHSDIFEVWHLKQVQGGALKIGYDVKHHYFKSQKHEGYSCTVGW